MPQTSDFPVLPAEIVKPEEVGRRYDVAIGKIDGSAIYGYQLDNLQEEGTFGQDSDIRSKDQLSQVSPNLIDQYLTDWPRITDGDFSGGSLQVNFIDAQQYWDGDLDHRQPGYLQLRSGWNPFQLTPTSFGAQITFGPQRTFIPGPPLPIAYVTYGETAPNRIYAIPSPTTPPTSPPIVPKFLVGDRKQLVVADGVPGPGGSVAVWDPTTNAWTTIRNNLPTVTQIWLVDNGPNLYFLYYTYRIGNGENVESRLAYIDLGAAGFPSTDVAMGAGFHDVVDIAPISGGVAVAVNTRQWVEVWQTSGLPQVAAPLVRIPSYLAGGITNCLGNLFLTLDPASGFGAGFIAQITGSNFQLVKQVGDVKPHFAQQHLGAPVTSGHRIFFARQTGAYTDTPSTPLNEIDDYDILTGAFGRIKPVVLGAGRDAIGNPFVRGMVVSGEGVIQASTVVGTGVVGGFIFAQASSGVALVTHPTTFQDSGTLISSRIDFNTPGVTKLFRRVTVSHTPLATGEKIQIDCFIDQDPTTPFGAPVASTTNSSVNSTQTEIQFPINTQGRSLVFKLTLTAGTTDAVNKPARTSPVVYFVTTQVSTPFIWTLKLAIASRRVDGAGQPGRAADGLSATHLKGLLDFIWLTGQDAIMITPDGLTWKVAMEDYKFRNRSPNRQDVGMERGEIEGFADVKLRALPG